MVKRVFLLLIATFAMAIVDLISRVQLLIIYSTFVKYLRKIGIQWGSASAIYRLQESL
jgi:hypothetical protein